MRRRARPGGGVEGGALGFGDGRRYGEARAHAAAARLPEQFGARLDDRAEHLGRVGVDGLAAGGGRDETASEADQGGAEAVGVHLGGEGHGPVLGEFETVRGAAL